MFIDDRSDYTGFSNEARASIQMTHSANGPKVSLEEAQRIERETAEHLLGARKLSLIVDLDQTIVHATVDPTVGDWITEGEAWEERRARKRASPEADSDSDESIQDEDDEVNPNWEALKDVKKFRLRPESFGLPPWSDKHRTKRKVAEAQGCLYYVKPRYVPTACAILVLTVVALQSRMAWLPQQCGNQV
jgi:RNA polymerase II subunit A-like phosphatase